MAQTRLFHSTLAVCAALLLATVLTNPVHAAEVRFSISAREAYVNQPLTLSIEIENAETFQRPELPKIEAAAVNPNPSESTGIVSQIVNGRATMRKTTTLSYRIVPFKPGVVTIPPISVIADGQTFTSEPIEIIINQSETGDLMFAEILADRLTVYLGEPVHLRLRIWIKPFYDRQFDYRLTPEDSWNLIDPNATNWGDFAEPLTQQRGVFGSLHVAGEEVIRTDEQGNRGAYFLYEISTTIWPTRTGPIQLNQPVVVMNYPLRLARQTDFFSRGSLRVADARPISISPSPPPVEVVSAPSQGAPPTFNGAVGDYSITVSARPTEVAVGDPITLTIRIRDHGDTENAARRLNLVPPPPLDRVAELTENFRVPDEPLAGTVTGNAKVFTQTVRAKSERVTRIPAIPLSFFDPATETYVTRASDPIPIVVKAGSQIGVSDIVAAPSSTLPRPQTSLRTVSGGILANYTADEALSQEAPFRMTWLWVALLAAPPALFAGLALTRTSARFRRRNAAAIRRRNAARRAIARVKSAQSGDQRSQAQAALAAVGDYIADRLNLPARAFTSAEIAAVLREHAAPEDVIAQIRTMLDQCEQLVYAGGPDPVQSETISHQALVCIKALERLRLK